MSGRYTGGLPAQMDSEKDVPAGDGSAAFTGRPVDSKAVEADAVEQQKEALGDEAPAEKAPDAPSGTRIAEPEEESTEDSLRQTYEEMTVADLREEARTRNLEGFSQLNKADLVDLLVQDDAAE